MHGPIKCLNLYQHNGYSYVNRENHEVFICIEPEFDNITETVSNDKLWNDSVHFINIEHLAKTYVFYRLKAPNYSYTYTFFPNYFVCFFKGLKCTDSYLTV